MNHMADEEKYLLIDKSHWTYTKTGRVFQVDGVRTQPETCSLCGAERPPIETGHCRRPTVEQFLAFARELRVVDTLKPYPENDCPGCEQGERVWESARFPDFMRHHKPTQIACLKFVPPDQIEFCRNAKYEG